MSLIKHKTVRGYKDEFYPPVPNKFTLFMRRFIPWQIYRFIVLNIKIMRIVIGGHS